MTKESKKYESTAEEIAFDEELAREIAERVLRSHRHSLIVFILFFVVLIYMRLLCTETVTIDCHT